MVLIPSCLHSCPIRDAVGDARHIRIDTGWCLGACYQVNALGKDAGKAPGKGVGAGTGKRLSHEAFRVYFLPVKGH
jgi:hypothetical protein